MLKETIVRQFNEIKASYESAALSKEEKTECIQKRLALVERAISDGGLSEKEDMMFAMWNISDCYALLRDGEKLFENHKKLEALVNGMAAKYLFATVIDATQRLTLSLYGKEDYWYQLYQSAVHSNSDITEENEIAAFNSHRAAMYVTPYFHTKSSYIDMARKELENFLAKTRNSPMQKYYNVIYSSNILKIYGEKQDLPEQCERLMSDLAGDDADCPYLLGQWEELNWKRTPRERASIGINEAVNAFLYAGDIETAKTIYHSAVEMGLKSNTYIEKRLNECQKA